MPEQLVFIESSGYLVYEEAGFGGKLKLWKYREEMQIFGKE